MSTEDEVRRFSDRYYTALGCLINGDARPMMEVWSHSSDVTAMNPYGGRDVGWEQLLSVFERVAQSCSGSRFTVGRRNSLIQVCGDLAYETGVEFGEGTIAGKPTSIEHRVTNIYRREAEGWKIVHRHTDLNPAEQDEFRRSHSSQGQASS
jgi:ketosteroid isomerase-like protein